MARYRLGAPAKLVARIFACRARRAAGRAVACLAHDLLTRQAANRRRATVKLCVKWARRRAYVLAVRAEKSAIARLCHVAPVAAPIGYAENRRR